MLAKWVEQSRKKILSWTLRSEGNRKIVMQTVLDYLEVAELPNHDEWTEKMFEVMEDFSSFVQQTDEERKANRS